jgi:hypothetical protein
MPITTPTVYAEQLGDPEHFIHVLDSLFKPALSKAGYDIVPPISSGSELIQAAIIKNLEECDLVLCDISALNANVFFELGIRTALNRPVVLVRDSSTTTIPFDTGSINTHTYDVGLRAWLIESEIEKLAQHITVTSAKSDGQNPLWRFFGITQVAQPAQIDDPNGAKLDLILAEMSDLKRGAERAPAAIYNFSSPPANWGFTGSAVAGTFTPAINMSSGAGNSWIDGLAYNPNLIPVSSAPKPIQSFSETARAIALREGVSLMIEGYDTGSQKLIMNGQGHHIPYSVARQISNEGLKAGIEFELRS